MARDFHPERHDPRGLQKNQRALEILLGKLFAMDGEELFLLLAGKSGGQTILQGVTIEGGFDIPSGVMTIGGHSLGERTAGGATPLDLQVNALRNLIYIIDSDNNSTNASFLVSKDGGVSSILLLVDESGKVTFGSGSPRFIGRTATAADPTTTELPADKDFGLHKNTSSGAVFLAYNDGGAIKKVALT